MRLDELDFEGRSEIGWMGNPARVAIPDGRIQVWRSPEGRYWFARFGNVSTHWFNAEGFDPLSAQCLLHQLVSCDQLPTE